LASVNQDKTIRIWDLETGQSSVLYGHSDMISCLEVLPDGRLASGSSDGTILIWDVDTSDYTAFKGHSSDVISLTAVPNGRLVSGSNDKTIQTWDIRNGKMDGVGFLENKANDFIYHFGKSILIVATDAGLEIFPL